MRLDTCVLQQRRRRADEAEDGDLPSGEDLKLQSFALPLRQGWSCCVSGRGCRGKEWSRVKGWPQGLNPSSLSPSGLEERG